MRNQRHPFASGFWTTCGFIAALVLLFAFLPKTEPAKRERIELEAEADYWSRKRYVTPDDSLAYGDFAARYRRTFGREWND